jgi:hypothetical protein
MADISKVIDKVRKLLALGTSPNENEAASAVAMAHKLLEDFDLTIESVNDLKADPRTSIRKGNALFSTTEGKPEGWKSDLFLTVARTFDCFTAYAYETETTKAGRDRTVKHGNLIGFGHDVEAAGYALSFLIGEITRLAQDHADDLWADIRRYRDANDLTQHDAESFYVQRTGRHPLKAKLYFIKGATEAVCRKLDDDYWVKQSAAHQPDNPYALMVDKRRSVEDFIYMERYGKTKAEYDAEWDARHAMRKSADAPAPVETEAERRKREKRWAQWQETQRRKREREEAKVDRQAYEAGSEAGSQISIRPGLKGSTPIGKLE